MKFDAKLARILSGFFLDVSKAYFIGTFITPTISGVSTFLEAILLLTRGLANVILFLVLSWLFAKMEE